MRRTDSQFVADYQTAVADGLTMPEIAARFGVSEYAVQKRRVALAEKGIHLEKQTRKKRVDKRRDSTVKEMVKRLGKSTRR